MLLSATLVRSQLILLIVMLANFGTKEATGAQLQSLSRITTGQITKLLQLPPGVAIYEPPAECNDPNDSQCSGMDRAKKLFTVSDDSSPQLSECNEMRLFRFTGIKHLNMVASLCQQGPFTLPELNETRTELNELLNALSKAPPA